MHALLRWWNRCDITKKVIFGISLILIGVFITVTTLINIGIAKNSDTVLTSIMSALEKDQQKSVDILRNNFSEIAAKLQQADDKIERLILDLYTSSYETLVRAIANQIFPMVGAFDFDSAGKVINDLLASSKAIKWVEYTTSEKPSAADTYTFGKQTTEESKIFTHQIKGDFSFLRIQMQVSLAEMRAINEVNQAFEDINRDNSDLATLVEKNGRESLENARASSGSIARQGERKLTGSIIVAMIAVLIMACLFLIFFIRGWIIRPINTTIQGLANTSGRVASGSEYISGTSRVIAEGAAEQAASLEETSSSLEEMSSMTRQNAENSTLANTKMEEARQMMSQANEAMRKLNGAMEEISKTSEETSKINKTIDEIAFQTNLLALNAAVEAARAGEAGAGFAVVADEVRNLAMRAAESAKGAAQIINSTTRTVRSGAEMVKTTNEAFQSMSLLTEKVASLVNEITSASTEQSKGITQINSAVSEQDRAVQTSAAEADRLQATAQELSVQAKELDIMIAELIKMVGGNVRGEGRPEPALMAAAGQNRSGRRPLLPPD